MSVIHLAVVHTPYRVDIQDRKRPSCGKMEGMYMVSLGSTVQTIWRQRLAIEIAV
jgi:hypothetical protein